MMRNSVIAAVLMAWTRRLVCSRLGRGVGRR